LTRYYYHKSINQFNHIRHTLLIKRVPFIIFTHVYQ